MTVPEAAMSPVTSNPPAHVVMPVTFNVPPILAFFSTPRPPPSIKHPVSLSIDWVALEITNAPLRVSPDKVTVPAVKSPLASLATNVFPVLTDVPATETVLAVEPL